ncbi:Hypothetical predicted protein [Pelobates cultripes]|uniref:Anti-proliferative protein domain-containing protein n=1 Tax=Pelobates cultripes TaxID=61616 RepID=A0AAD1T8Z5_PELCU|nr:Hypothetical predicted protein [Pelobates cultripes]
MHQEISAAVHFLLEILHQKNRWTPLQLEVLGSSLLCNLSERYNGHWYPEHPSRGQAYRCIRINAQQAVDESLLMACEHSGIEYSKLGLPEELTIWVDPYEVCGRYRENSKYFTIAMFSKEIVELAAPSPTENETSDYSSGSVSSEPSSEDELIVEDTDVKDSNYEDAESTDPEPSDSNLIQNAEEMPVQTETGLMGDTWQSTVWSCDESLIEGSRFMSSWKDNAELQGISSASLDSLGM